MAVDFATLPELTARAAGRWGERTALLFDQTGDTLSFADIEAESAAIAGRLAAEGIRAGDRVALMVRNCAAFPLTWLAIARLGAAMVPLNVGYRAADAGYILDHAAPRAIVCAEEFAPLLTDVITGLAERPRLLVTDPRARTLADGAPAAPAVAVAPDMPTNIQYTSGTTGHPKGCVLAHSYWSPFVRRILGDIVALDERDVMLTAQPFYYLDPQWNLAVALASGARLIVLDGFHPSTIWSKLRGHGATFFYCLGAMPALMMKMPPDPADRDNRLRKILCSAIPPSLHRALEDRWGVPWLEAFGMTETGVDLAVSDAEHDATVGTGCIGRPLWGREARVVDEDDRPVPPGSSGELVLRGPGMLSAYYRNESATVEAFRNGWFHTGDVVRQDAEGRFFYMTRKKDMIRRSGENIAAAEVEEVIQAHAGVLAAACVPEPDELRGEEVKAFVVLAAGLEVDDVPPAALIAHCGARLARFKIPRFWSYRRGDFPRTPSERVAKRDLVAEEAERGAPVYDAAQALWLGGEPASRGDERTG